MGTPLLMPILNRAIVDEQAGAIEASHSVQAHTSSEKVMRWIAGAGEMLSLRLSSTGLKGGTSIPKG